MTKFELVYQQDGKKKVYGYLYFNEKFIFELKEDVPYEFWERFGIIPVDEKTRRFESDDLFYYLNARLPIRLRHVSSEKKLEYINKSGLRVPSDNFYLSPA